MAVSHAPREAAPIQIKGSSDGLIVNVDEALGDDWLRVLAGEFVATPDFWRGGRVVLSVGRRRLERQTVVDALHLFERYGMRLWAVLSDCDETVTAARELSLAVRLPGGRTGAAVRPPVPHPALAAAGGGEPEAEALEPAEPEPAPLPVSAPVPIPVPVSAPVPIPVPAAPGPVPAAPEPAAAPAERSAAAAPGSQQAAAQADEEEDEEEDEMSLVEGPVALILKETLRSGRSIRHGGPVIVFGDVNPGAEILAAGDVVVWGKLRGLVHAGASGDVTAAVCALDLNPTQLRIADRITVPPKDARRHAVPEMAVIRDGRIVAEPWRGKA